MKPLPNVYHSASLIYDGDTEDGNEETAARLEHPEGDSPAVEPKETEQSFTVAVDKELYKLIHTFEQLPKHKPPVSAHSIIQTILQSKPFTRHRIFKRNHERHNTFIFIKFRGKQ